MPTTISIEMSDAEFTVLQSAMSFDNDEVSQADVTASVVKTELVNTLKNIVTNYDKSQNVTVNYSSFAPS